MDYTLSITCPICHFVSQRRSSAPFVYLDEAGIAAHAQHEPGCQGAGLPLAYVVVRDPDEHRQLDGDPQPPEGDT